MQRAVRSESLTPVWTRLAQRLDDVVDSRWTVPIAAVAAFLLRLPGLTRPIRADEAGFTLVGQAWDPRADSVYGPYFVDRPPLLIELYRGLRRARGAAVHPGRRRARLRAARGHGRERRAAGRDRGGRPLDRGRGRRDHHQHRDQRGGREGRAARAAVPDGQPVARPARGPGPLVGARPRRPACWPAWRSASSRTWSAAWSSPPSCSSASAVAGRITRADLVRLALAATAGAAIPVLGTVGWAWSAGVDLDALWYAVYGFRFDAAGVLTSGGAESETVRAALLVVSALGAGMLLVIGGFVVHIRGEWEDDAPAHRRRRRDARRRHRRARARRQLLAGLPVPAATGHRPVRRAPGPAAEQARRRDARGHRGRGRVDAAAAGRRGPATRRWGSRSSTRSTPARPCTRWRSPATRSSSSAAGPTSSSPAAWRRRTSTSGACRCAPWTPSSPTCAALVTGPDAPTWIVEWVPFDTWSTRYGGELAGAGRGPLRAARRRLRRVGRRAAHHLAAEGHRPRRPDAGLPRRAEPRSGQRHHRLAVDQPVAGPRARAAPRRTAVVGLPHAAAEGQLGPVVRVQAPPGCSTGCRSSRSTRCGSG